ncbi:MAG: hypothetical protein ABTS16_01930 [Candidatus Accumulibacter phosphatis]|jgi:hypothetical protein|uniref:Uncharacterized protein n=1 Tax=Candidatus Accumulibacter contiguus TaxID=2954381 RepID=A0ABX1T982_9PROT|nr:hypothetical protein [Candidatus Accumulibacter contiguus]NMQ05556.1 hypothetical protein [Candidatus Accumulibacter contiguus]
MSTIERRLNKLEEIRNRNDVGDEVDKLFEKMGTSRAAMLADFGSLWKFRDWLVARSAAADHQAGVPIAAHPRQWQGDCAISAKWDAILDHADALQSAASAP